MKAYKRPSYHFLMHTAVTLSLSNHKGQGKLFFQFVNIFCELFNSVY
jgi:hypothetical protein